MLSTNGLLDGYDRGSFFCELMDCAAHDPCVALIAERLSRMDPAELRRRAAIAEAELYNQGITFTVYSDKDAIDRILPFDLIPRVLTAGEWDVLERGVRQRVAALNAFIGDIYHDQRILRDCIVPARPGAWQQQLPAGNGRPGRAARHLRACLRCRYRARRNRRLPGAGRQCAHAVRRVVRPGKPQHDAAAVSRSDGRHTRPAGGQLRHAAATGAGGNRAIPRVVAAGRAAVAGRV